MDVYGCLILNGRSELSQVLFCKSVQFSTMSYFLIKGHFHIVGHSPDGDSIKLRANNRDNWDKIMTDHRAIFEEKLADKDAKTGVSEVVTLRLQGIDALETHYTPPTPQKPRKEKKTPKTGKPRPGKHEQPDGLGKQAANFFMHYLGVKRVKWKHPGYVSEIEVKRGRKRENISKKFEDALPGYIIVRDVERKGRPISWVFAGTTRTNDGSSVKLSALKRKIQKECEPCAPESRTCISIFLHDVAFSPARPAHYSCRGGHLGGRTVVEKQDQAQSCAQKSAGNGSCRRPAAPDESSECVGV